MRFGLKGCIAALALALMTAGARAEDASAYPSRDIVFIVPYAAGGATDILARLIAEKLRSELGREVVIENKPGGNGTIGAVAAANAKPDGYTIYLGGISTMSVAPALSANLPYDPNKDFAPISLASTQNLMLLVTSTFPAKTLQEYIDAAKSDPDGLAYATSGNGTSGHMAASLFELAADVKLNHIPYKGSAPALNDLIGGHVPSMFGTMLGAVPHVQSGALRALAISGSKRSPVLPDIPTFAEQGLTDYNPGAWNAIYAPAGTPDPIIEKLNAAIKVALTSKSLVDKLAADGAVPTWSTPEDLAAHQVAEQAKWKSVVDKAGIKID